MSLVTPRLLTVEDLWRLPGNGKQRALVRGEVIETLPPGGRHGVIISALGTCLALWARSGPGGCVGVESGFILARDPDTVRGPDVFYVRAERILPSSILESY